MYILTLYSNNFYHKGYCAQFKIFLKNKLMNFTKLNLIFAAIKLKLEQSLEIESYRICLILGCCGQILTLYLIYHIKGNEEKFRHFLSSHFLFLFICNIFLHYYITFCWIWTYLEQEINKWLFFIAARSFLRY